MLSRRGMLGLRSGRLRAILLLVAFGLSIAGQALAATAVADQSAAASTQPTMMVKSTGGISHCPGCDRANNAATMPSCAVALFCGLVAVQAQAARVEILKAVVFAPPTDTFPHGIAVRPEPHPPRSPASL